jgi:hypothetical protein
VNVAGLQVVEAERAPSGVALTAPSESAASRYLGSMLHAGRRRDVSSHRRRVLVVEDDDAFAEAVKELLEADGRLEVSGRARDGR